MRHKEVGLHHSSVQFTSLIEFETEIANLGNYENYSYEESREIKICFMNKHLLQ